MQRSEAILKAWEGEMPHWKDKWVLSFNLSPFGSVSKNNMLKCCVNSISSLSSGHIIIVKIRKMNWEIIVSISVLINILPPEPSSSSWGCDDSPSSPSPQRNQQIFVSAPAAYCTASPCWDIRSGNKCDVMKYFYRKFRVHKQMLLWVLLLFKERKVDEELWNVDDFLEVKVILTSEQRVGTFGLKGHFENLITKWQRIRCLQTFTVEGGKEKSEDEADTDSVIQSLHLNISKCLIGSAQHSLTQF